MKKLPIPGFIRKNLLGILYLYNQGIQDNFLFENYLEVAPSIIKLQKLFESMKIVNKKGHIMGEDEKGNPLPLITSDKLKMVLENFIDLFKKTFNKRFINSYMELSLYEYTSEVSGALHQFLLGASGVQRAMMTVFFECHNSDKVSDRACLVTQGEGQEASMHYHLIPIIEISMLHLTSPQQLNLLFHETGHFFRYSDFMEDILNSPLYSEEIKEEPLKPPRIHKENDELFFEIIADLFDLYFGCNIDIEFFSNKYWFSLHTSTLLPDASISDQEYGERLIRHFLRYFWVLCVHKGKNPENINEFNEIYELALQYTNSKLINNRDFFLHNKALKNAKDENVNKSRHLYLFHIVCIFFRILF